MLKLAKIEQSFICRQVRYPQETFTSLLSSSEFNRRIKDCKRIAIAVGSRGIKIRDNIEIISVTSKVIFDAKNRIVVDF